jgi:hypothetical protein
MRNTVPTAYTTAPTVVTVASGRVRRNQRSRCRNPSGHVHRNVGHDRRNHRSRWTEILSLSKAAECGPPRSRGRPHASSQWTGKPVDNPAGGIGRHARKRQHTFDASASSETQLPSQFRLPLLWSTTIQPSDVLGKLLFSTRLHRFGRGVVRRVLVRATSSV